MYSIQRMHTVPKDIAHMLKNNPNVSACWNTLTPLAKNEWICWVTIVKKEETRIAHITRMKEELLKGKKRPCCWPGCPHRRDSAKKWFGKRV